ncbi:transporter [Polaromonas sp. YR568]|uniref:transporter n=1 Tax=Polaromonas sp. YR568 TaxID=1855301 RepID=UPI00398BF275
MDITYGADRTGLLCGYRFENGAPGVPVDLLEAAAWLQSGAPKGKADFVWLHFNLSDAAAEASIRKHLNAVPEFFEALHEGSRSTRIEDAHDTLIAVVNDVAYEFAFDPAEMSSLWLNVAPHMALSARSHPLRSIDRLRDAVKNGTPLESSVSFLNHLLREQGDVLVRIVRDATVQVDVIEDNFLVGRLHNRRADLGKLRRVLVRLQRLLAPEPGALFRLLRLPPPWVSERDLEELRQATEEFSLTIRDMSELKERIKLLQEEIAAQVSEETNRSVFILTMVTVLALPINIVAGLLGMNVGGVPLADSPHGFMVIVVIIGLFTAFAAWYVYRQKQ